MVSAEQAVGALGAGWTAGAGGSLEREFTFDDFKQASNFMNRYADYCAQLNHTPSWSNVYNRVNVTLLNNEFDGVTEKEVQIGQYLNTVSRVTLNQDVDRDLSFEQITSTAELDSNALLNDQNEATSLFSLDEGKQARQSLRLTQ